MLSANSTASIPKASEWLLPYTATIKLETRLSKSCKYLTSRTNLIGNVLSSSFPLQTLTSSSLAEVPHKSSPKTLTISLTPAFITTMQQLINTKKDKTPHTEHRRSSREICRIWARSNSMKLFSLVFRNRNNHTRDHQIFTRVKIWMRQVRWFPFTQTDLERYRLKFRRIQLIHLGQGSLRWGVSSLRTMSL